MSADLAAFSMSSTCLRRSSRDDVLGREVVVDVDAELALAGVLGQVADMAVGGEDAVIRAEIALDRPRLGRRLDDHEVLWHGRECSTGSCTRPVHSDRVAARRDVRARRARVSSDLADAAEEVLVDLELALVVGRSGACGSTDRSGDRHRTGRSVADRDRAGAGPRRTGCAGTGR